MALYSEPRRTLCAGRNRSRRTDPAAGSDREPLSSLGTSPLEREAAALRAHPDQEAVSTMPLAIVGLECALHERLTQDRIRWGFASRASYSGLRALSSAHWSAARTPPGRAADQCALDEARGNL